MEPSSQFARFQEDKLEKETEPGLSFSSRDCRRGAEQPKKESVMLCRWEELEQGGEEGGEGVGGGEGGLC